MRRDFLLKIYREMLDCFLCAGYRFTTFEGFLSYPFEKVVILRHDVDKRPDHALEMALIEKKLNIKASYYFRIVKESYNEIIMKKIAEMEHEIGYHYEDLALSRGDFSKAIDSFEKNLNRFRENFAVKTICMHGSAFSKWDNRLLWGKYDYKDFGVIGEPYLDIAFNNVLYLTDTGRTWNNRKISIRDKVDSQLDYPMKTTHHIKAAIKENKLPPKIMLNVHPQRWTNGLSKWCAELFVQRTKNIIKKIIVIRK